MQLHDHTTSEAEEMYIITVARAIEDGEGPPVSMSTVARTLEVSSVSANQMVRKLEGLGLVTYTPYKGVDLTDAGAELANTVLRSRRLWGVFLAEHLGLSARQADEVACEMEHVTPAEVADRLSAFLGDPTTGPEGRSIPRSRGAAPAPERHLGDVGAGASATIERINPAYATFLEAQGVAEGIVVQVLGTGSDGSVLVEGPSGPIHLTSSVARAVAIAS